MSFKDALHVVSTEVITKLITPKWAMGLTAHLRKTRLAYEELDVRNAEVSRTDNYN